MRLPAILEDFSPDKGEDLLHSVSLAVLGAFQHEHLIGDLELEYGFEDLPLLDDLAGVLREGMIAWVAAKGVDAAALLRGFVHAFLAGMDVAAQLHRRDGDGLHLDGSLEGIFDGRVLRKVGKPLDAAAPELMLAVEDAFVTFQDQILKAIASTRNDRMLLDFWAIGCLWAALAGVEVGLRRVPEPA